MCARTRSERSLGTSVRMIEDTKCSVVIGFRFKSSRRSICLFLFSCLSVFFYGVNKFNSFHINWSADSDRPLFVHREIPLSKTHERKKNNKNRHTYISSVEMRSESYQPVNESFVIVNRRIYQQLKRSIHPLQFNHCCDQSSANQLVQCNERNIFVKLKSWSWMVLRIELSKQEAEKQSITERQSSQNTI